MMKTVNKPCCWLWSTKCQYQMLFFFF